MFKLKPFEKDSDKKELMKKIKSSLENLKNKISVIKEIEVQFNVNPEEEYDIILDTTFESMEDLKTYATHPEHVKASQLIVENREKRACVDYEF